MRKSRLKKTKLAKKLILVFCALILLTFFISPAAARLSLSKYVLETQTYNISVASAKQFPITEMAAISGTTQVGQILTVGALTPSDAAATATYQWYSCSAIDGNYTEISGAVAASYTLTADECTKFIKVIATGNGAYTGNLTGASVGPVSAAAVSIAAIEGVTVPVKGEIPDVTVASNLEYTVAVTWLPTDTPFKAYTVYTAFVTVTPKTGYTLSGVSENFFTAAGAAATNMANSGVVIAIFPRTAAAVIDIAPITGVTSPFIGDIPVGTLAGTDEYTATISWSPADSTFQSDVIYTATITLTPKTGYTVTGVAQNLFTVTSATATNSGNSGIVTAVFPRTKLIPISLSAIEGVVAPVKDAMPVSTVTETAQYTATISWSPTDSPFIANTVYTATISITPKTGYTLTGVAQNFFTVAGATAAHLANSDLITAVFPATAKENLSGVSISGTPEIGQLLTAGSLTPAGATASYQWQRCDTAEGTYSDISGATAGSYTLTPDDLNRYIKVAASGTGDFTATVTSNPTSKISGIPLISVSEITGTTRQYETLTAGVPSPVGATVSFQWLRADTETGPYTEIAGATATTYTLVFDDNNHYIKVRLTGTGNYSGSVESACTGPVVFAATAITAMAAISGTPYIGQTLTAGALTPAEATATYQWQQSTSLNGTYTNISGATNSTYYLTAAALNQFYRVVATGSGTFSGTVNAAIGPIKTNAQQITAIGSISGSTVSGQLLTAGTLSPAEATVTYQWQRSDTNGSIYTDIASATTASYTLSDADLNCYLKVVVTGYGSYTGTVTSARTGPVVTSTISVTAIGAVTGTAQVGSTLTAGTLTPTNATVTYQWQVADVSAGTYTPISNATASTYLVTAADFSKTLRVAVTGSGSYAATVYSAAVGLVSAGPVTAITNISGTAVTTYTVTAGTVTPAGATVNFEWRRYTTIDPAGTYTVIGSNSASYLLVTADVNTYLRVAATGTTAYTGTVLSNYIVPKANSGGITVLTDIADSIGLTEVFQSLTAGTVTPYGATVTYQWYRCDTATGTYTAVAGATSKTYNVLGNDKGYFFKVEATGSSSYSGVVRSRFAGPITAAPIVAIGSISGTATIGQVITAGSVTPAAAAVNYQWQRSDLNGEGYTDIAGATSNTYTLTASDENRYLKVTVTGFGYYTGTLTSVRTGPVKTDATPITALNAIDGVAQVGRILTAGTTTPLGATVTYQWQRCDTSNGTYTDIGGATIAAYTLTPSDLGKYIKLVIYGAGIYSTPPTGISSAAFGPVAVCPITAISNIIGKAEVDQILTAGTVTPYGATVSYQWQRYVNGIYTPISGATASTYTLVSADNNYYIRVAATGTSGYSGIVESNNTGPVGSPNAISSINAITGVTKVSQILTAGMVLPYGSSVSYQWQNSSEADGTYANIGGAIGTTYTVTASDYGKYLKVIAEGTGVYFGQVISIPTDIIIKGSITAISSIQGSTISGQTLTAGAVTPTGATVTYQWQRSDTSGNNYTNITDATASTYLLTNTDVARYLRVVVTGSQSYESSVTSLPTAVISTSGTVMTPLTSIATATGTARVGQALTAGAILPSNATVTYQWQRSADASDSAYANISGAVSSTYLLTAADFGKYVRPVATGGGTYSGSVNHSGTSVTLKQLVTAGDVTGTPAVGETVVAGVLTPAEATVTYQWKFASKNATSYSNISGATSRSYTIVDANFDGYLKVLIFGTGAYETADPVNGLLSAAYGRIEQYPFKITAISAINGTTQVGQVLYAGTTTPYGAAVTYQWLRKAAGTGTYVEITGAGAIASSYTTTNSDFNAYLKVVVTGAGSFSGWVESAPTALITAAPLTAIDGISGTVVSGQTIAAGSLTPLDATATYQWQRSDSSDLNFNNIIDATGKTYLLGASDLNCYLKVIATGTGGYTGTVTSVAAGPVSASSDPITSIGLITGTATVNQTLTAGTICPTGASVTYQWKRADTTGGTYVAINGATNSQYTLTAADYGKYIKVVATGSGNYAGSVEDTAVKGPIAACPITEIGAFTGSCNVGQSLVTGAITPSNATVTYQWYLSDNKNVDLNDLTANRWTLIGATTDAIVVPENKIGSGAGTSTLGYYIKVVATGSGAFSGSQSKGVGPIGSVITLTPLTGIGSIIGTTAPTQIVSAGSLTPSNATVTYQWQRCLSSDGTYENIPGATSTSYPIQNGDLGYYLKVTATGTGSYTGVVISGYKGPVIALNQTIPITAISDILYTTARNVTLTAGTVTPLLATVTYQWQVSTSIAGPYVDIAAATASTFTIPLDQTYGCYFKVEATGSGSYTGTVTSNYTGPVVDIPTSLTSVSISGTVQAGQVLTANVLPSGATVTYQWQISTTANGTFTDLGGATSSTFFVTVVEYNYYLRVVAIGSGAYTGTVVSSVSTQIAAFPISDMAAISGTPEVGSTLTAGALIPAAATVVYQWQISDTGNGASFTNLSGATDRTLVLTANEFGKYLRVIATGSGAYSGTYTSAGVGPVLIAQAAPMALDVSILGTTLVGESLTVSYTYFDVNGDLEGDSLIQWYANETAISDATEKTLVLTASELGAAIFFEVTPVAGAGTSPGIAMQSAATAAVTAKTIDISAISGITVPIKDVIPDTTVEETDQYTATLVWEPSADNQFSSNTVYTAVITLTAKDGYTTAGIAANYFTVDGATTVTNSVDSGTVSATFLET